MTMMMMMTTTTMMMVAVRDAEFGGRDARWLLGLLLLLLGL